MEIALAFNQAIANKRIKVCIVIFNNVFGSLLDKICDIQVLKGYERK